MERNQNPDSWQQAPGLPTQPQVSDNPEVDQTQPVPTPSPVAPIPTTQASPQPPKSNKVLKIGLFLMILVLLGLGGFILIQNQTIKEKLFPIKTSTTPTETPTTSPTPTSTSDPTVNWKTYTNDTHNIMFKYSPLWTLTEEKGQVEKNTTYNTMVKLLKDNATITMYFNMDGIGGMPQNYEGIPFILDGNNLYQYNKVNDHNNTKLIGISNSLNTLGVFMLNNVTYSITLEYPTSYDKTKETESVNEFNQILSTFKFTDEQPSSITTEEIDRGWYWGTEEQKKSGTPDDWIYQEAGRSSCWHKPDVSCTL